MKRIAARFHQFRIAHQGFVEIPANHAICTFEPIERPDPIHRVAKCAYDFSPGDQLGDPLAGFRGSEVRGSNFSDLAIRRGLAIMSGVPFQSTLEMLVEKTSLLVRMGKQS